MKDYECPRSVERLTEALGPPPSPRSGHARFGENWLVENEDE